MRIISGINKGKRLHLPDNNFTRPLRDMVKESIFNLLTHSNKTEIDIENANILDLFAGSGSFGLECISRGSSFVYFFEKQQIVLKTLKQNINLLTRKDNYKIFEEDIIEFFLSKRKIDKKFDIIFIDAPFKEMRINVVIEKILEKKMLTEKGIIILHRHKNDKIQITNQLNIFETRTYGVSKIYFAN